MNKHAIISTDYIYKEYYGKFKLENAEIDVIVETEKGMKINHVLSYDENLKKWVYTTYWIPKSKITSIKYVNKLPMEAKKEYDEFCKLYDVLGHKVLFTFEEYLKKVNE